VCTCALWIIGEYSLSLQEIEGGISVIKQSLGDLPFYTTAEEGEVLDTSATKPGNQTPTPPTASKRPAILADGTYATQVAVAATVPSLMAMAGSTTANLRAILLTGDFFLGAVVATTFTKLILRLKEVQSSNVAVNKATADALLIMVSILRLGQSAALPHLIDDDSYDRISLCIRVLSGSDDGLKTVWLKLCRESFVKMIADKQYREMEETKALAQESYAQPDDLIDFYHLKSRKVREKVERARENLHKSLRDC
jgi:coatomer subunit beta